MPFVTAWKEVYLKIIERSRQIADGNVKSFLAILSEKSNLIYKILC